jgi:hypothetical protein
VNNSSESVVKSSAAASLWFLFGVDISYATSLLPNQSREQALTCQLPKLELSGHSNVEKYVPCKMKHEWGYLKHGRWHLNQTVTSQLDGVSCEYRNVSREDDFKLTFSPYVRLRDGQPISSEVIEVSCQAKRQSAPITFNNILVQIVDKLDKVKSADQFSSSSSSSCEPLNILLLSYDSLSRVSWFRRLPQTTKYLLDEMKAQLLYGFNIMGDGTPACMIPLLTGRHEHELPSTLKSDPNGQYVDQAYPFIWNELHPKGYMSFHMEDWPQVSAFTYRLRGMSNRTAHHYMRAYQLSLWSRVSSLYFSRLDDFCIGTVKRHRKALSLIEEFIDTYLNRSRNHIAIMHYIENR